MPLERLRVQNAIIAAALAGSFFVVTYDKDSKEGAYGQDPGSFDAEHTQAGPFGASVALVAPPPTNALKRVKPASARCNETGAQFGTSRNTRTLGHDRISWSFELLLEFNEEVTVEQFEQEMLNPLILPRDVDLGLRMITIRLVSSAYTHPARMQPNQGTRVTFRFEAELSAA